MTFEKCLLAIGLLLVFQLPLFAQNDWSILKVKDGIKISSRHSPTSPFDDIRVELDVAGNIDQLEGILVDVNKYKEWSYATKVSRLVKSLGTRKIYLLHGNRGSLARNKPFLFCKL